MNILILSLVVNTGVDRSMTGKAFQILGILSVIIKNSGLTSWLVVNCESMFELAVGRPGLVIREGYII